MKLFRCVCVSLILMPCLSVYGQQNPPAGAAVPGYQTQYDSATGMAYDISRIATSVQAMTKTLKDFVDKFAKVEGITLSEKQQRLVMGMQILVQAEQRFAVHQKLQVELVEKEGQIRTRLAQVENDLDPQILDRSVAFEGSTRTPEIKEIRRRALMAERASLTAVLTQLQANLQEVGRDVRETQALVQRLRRTFLPILERELGEGW